MPILGEIKDGQYYDGEKWVVWETKEDRIETVIRENTDILRDVKELLASQASPKGYTDTSVVKTLAKKIGEKLMLTTSIDVETICDIEGMIEEVLEEHGIPSCGKQGLTPLSKEKIDEAMYLIEKYRRADIGNWELQEEMEELLKGIGIVKRIDSEELTYQIMEGLIMDKDRRVLPDESHVRIKEIIDNVLMG